MTQRYLITATKPALQVWHYEVDAASEEEAIEIVDSMAVDPIDYEVIDQSVWDVPTYEITSIIDLGI